MNCIYFKLRKDYKIADGYWECFEWENSRKAELKLVLWAGVFKRGENKSWWKVKNGVKNVWRIGNLNERRKGR